MSDVSLQLVREFFELNVFRVLTNWRQEPWRGAASDHSPHLLVENSRPRTGGDLPFIIPAQWIGAVERAVVHVRAWHADRFYPSVIESSPVLSQFETSEAFDIASHVFSNQPFVTILVLSELPLAFEPRTRSAALLQEAGIDHVIEFPSLLQDIIDRISINASYAASPALQILRLLKRYKFIRHQQLEFLFPAEPPIPDKPLLLETDDSTSSEESTDF